MQTQITSEERREIKRVERALNTRVDTYGNVIPDYFSRSVVDWDADEDGIWLTLSHHASGLRSQPYYPGVTTLGELAVELEAEIRVYGGLIAGGN